MSPSGSAPAPLPESIELRVYEICFGGVDKDRAIAELIAAWPQHEDGIRAVLVQLQRADTAVGKVRSVAAPTGLQAETGGPGLSRGAEIGPYTILRELGRGGFGVVYLAEQTAPVRRQVALKVVSTSARATDLLARFESERQVLAQLDHPFIARILDAGTTAAGQPYFAMDYLSGTAVTTFADAHRLDVEARLRLFLDVCAAVHHAHQRGVVHRDLKPGNVLVDMHDGAPRPHVIDFGLAKALRSAELAEEPGTTEFGRLLGTPEYMSPEQAAGRPIDTRTDVYSLGVMLYELLCGALPFASAQLRAEGLASVVRVLVSEDAEPPSAKLASIAADSADKAALLRRTTRSSLRQRIKGDLDQIVTACLHKDRERRYGSVADLAADVRRFLADEPVSVGPPSGLYVAWKFVRRHRAAVAAAALAMAALLGAVAVTSWSLVRVSAARNDAVTAADAASRNAYAAAMAMAQAAGESCRAGMMRHSLEGTDPQLRGLEWRLLAAQTEDAVRVVDLGGKHPNHLRCLDGYALFVDRDSDALWRVELADGSLRHIGKTSFHVDNTAVSRDRRLLALAGVEGRVAIFDPTTSLVVRDFQVASARDSVQCVALSNDGRLLAMGTQDEVQVLDVETGALRRRLRGLSGYLWGADFSADGTLLAAGDRNGTAAVWDLATGALLQSLPHPNIARRVALHPTRRVLATACRDGLLRTWSLDDGRLLAERETNAPLIHDFEYTADGATLVSAQSDGSVRLWHGETLRSLGSLRGHSNYISGLSLDRQGRLVTCAWDGSVRIWDPSPKRRFVRMEGMMGSTFCIRMNPVRQEIAACSLGGEVGCWSLDGAELRFARNLQVGYLHGLCYAPDGARIYVGGMDGALFELDARTGDLLRARNLGPDRSLRDVALVPGEAPLLVVSEARGDLLFVDPATLEVAAVLPSEPPFRGRNCYHVTVSPDGRYVASHDADGALGLADVQAKSWRWSLPPDSARKGCFSADGTQLVCGDPRGGVVVFDAATGARLRRFGRDDPAYGIADVQLTADGRRAVTADRQLRIWDFERGIELLALDGDRFMPSTLCVDEARGLLAAGAGYFTDPAELLVWPLSPR
jgi:serine/threonine protein kinase/WD40 repeat protein